MSVLVDANVLLYARFSDFPQHERAHAWLDGVLNETGPVGIPWVTLAAFVRIGTNRRILEQPLTPDEACEQIREWSERGNVWMPAPGEQFGTLFTQLLGSSQASGNLVSDAYLGALALEHGLSVVSTDADFRRFANVKWFNPLEAL